MLACRTWNKTWGNDDKTYKHPDSTNKKCIPVSCEHLLFPPDCLSSHRARLSCSSFWPLKSFLNPTFCAGNQNQSCVFRCVCVCLCVWRGDCVDANIDCFDLLLFFPPCIKNKTNFLYYPRRMLWNLCSLQSRMRHISPTQKKKISARSWGLHLKWHVAHKRRIWYAEQKLLKKKNHHKHLYTDRGSYPRDK